jgi:hypothetical protein
MNIFGYVAGTERKEIKMEHDGMTFTTYPARITSGEPVIGCYIDASNIPHLVFRDSLYGIYIMETFQDSRKYNPDGWAI